MRSVDSLSKSALKTETSSDFAAPSKSSGDWVSFDVACVMSESAGKGKRKIKQPEVTEGVVRTAEGAARITALVGKEKESMGKLARATNMLETQRCHENRLAGNAFCLLQFHSRCVLTLATA